MVEWSPEKSQKLKLKTMEIIAESKYVRISPRKASLVVKTLRGLSPQEALDKLPFINKSAASPLAKLIKSAIANAQNNAKLKVEGLRIKRLEVLTGSSFKRWRPISRGRAHPYQKRTSHLKVILEGEA